MALTPTFYPDRNLVQLVLDGAGTGWSTATAATITRSVAGASPVPVRGVERRPVVGGVLVWSDNEAPMDASVVYAATGVGPDTPVALTGTAATTGAAWGLWLKPPGRADLNCRVGLLDAGDMGQDDVGGSWTIPGGGRVSESAGLAPLTTTLSVQVDDADGLAAVRAAITQAPGRVLLLQTGQPEELPSGYYHVTSVSQANPGQLRSDLLGYRTLSIQVEAVDMPAGDSTGFSGVSHAVIAATFASHQEIKDRGLTHLDLATGNW
ncbi:hypothetical protein GCM10025864_39650 [Luteimicrobium album]|uniref:Phage tail protein n=1 Tax=Luteimicrobium album TaxID=1054550 RepID=A0ABQ6I7D5_9MICO|nr:hypothetical protein [Luteimicrobium album]GMA26206.1 hypothetical protein GCM10025864_39650 [Luteimicrobium album]